MSKEFSYFNYGKFIDNFINGFKSDLNIDLIEENNIGDKPSYPFATYSFTEPRHDVEKSMYGNKFFDIFVTFTFFSKSAIEVLNIASRANNWFKDAEVNYYLAEEGIQIVNVYDYTKRDNELSIMYERKSGFEVRIRVFDDNTQRADNPNISHGEINEQIKF